MLEGWPGEKLLIKLWDTVHQGGAAVLRPWQIKREAQARAEARRHELLDLQQIEQDAKLIKSGKATFQHGILVLLPAQSNDSKLIEGNAVEKASQGDRIARFAEVADRREQAESLRRATNLTKALVFAEEEAEEHLHEPISDEPVDPDWFARWQSYAQAVSNEDMQRLWGKILVGEAQQPTRYSLHAMHLLSCLSRQDAELTSIAAKFQIGDSMFRGAYEYYDKEGLSIDSLLKLESIGVLLNVSGSSGLMKTIEVKENNGERLASLIIKDDILLLYPDESRTIFHMPIMAFSGPACELLNLITTRTPESYLYQIAIWAKQNNATKIKRGKIKGRLPNNLFTASDIKDFA